MQNPMANFFREMTGTPSATDGPAPDGKIEVKLVRTNFYTRWPCTVCGGCTEKVGVLAEGPSVRVCERCLQSGDIDGHLARNAAELEHEAARVRGLDGQTFSLAEEADQHKYFAWELVPPIAHIDRPIGFLEVEAAVATEAAVHELVSEFGGEFIGT